MDARCCPPRRSLTWLGSTADSRATLFASAFLYRCSNDGGERDRGSVRALRYRLDHTTSTDTSISAASAVSGDCAHGLTLIEPVRVPLEPFGPSFRANRIALGAWPAGSLLCETRRIRRGGLAISNDHVFGIYDSGAMTEDRVSRPRSVAGRRIRDLLPSRDAAL